MKYHDQCGGELQTKKEGEVWYCPSCDQHLYANPIPTIDAVLFDENGRILLGIRSIAPEKGKLNLPGGFVDLGENLEEALARELKEELDLDPSEYSRLMYVGSRVSYHEQEGRRRQLVSIVMTARVKHRDFPANDEVDKFVWKLPSELKREEVTNPGEYYHIRRAAELKAED